MGCDTNLSLEYAAPTKFRKTTILCHDIKFPTHRKFIAIRQYLFSKPNGFLHVGIHTVATARIISDKNARA